MEKKKLRTAKKEASPTKNKRRGIAPAFDPATLIAGITKENRHAEIASAARWARDSLVPAESLTRSVLLRCLSHVEI